MQIILIDGGYQIEGDSFRIIQDFDPAKPFIDGKGQPFDSEAAAQAHAESVVAEQAALVAASA